MFWRVVLVACLLGIAPAAAAAQHIAIADVDAPAALGDQAGALSLVLRTYLGSDKQRIARPKVAAAIAEIGQSKPDRLTIKPEKAAELIAALDASRLLLSTLSQKGPRLELVMHGFGPDGKAQTAVVSAALGDYDKLARGAVEQGARLVGVSALRSPRPGSFASLADAGAASNALAAGNIKKVAVRFAAAPPRLGFEVRAVAEISEAIIASKGLALDLRINAALVAGDLGAARTLAASEASDPVAIAARARVEMVQLDYRAAGKTLAAAKRSKHPFVILARGALAAELGKTADASEHFGDLMGRHPYMPALVMAAKLPPMTLDKPAEAKLIASATAVREEYPRLASLVGVRAMRGGARSAEVFDLIDAYSLSAADLKELKIVINSLENDKVALRLFAEVLLREGDLKGARRASMRAVRLHPDDPRVAATAAVLEESEISDSDASKTDLSKAPVRSGVSKAVLASEAKVQSMTLLVADLELLLAQFPALTRKVGAVVLVAQEGNREFALWPLQVDAARLRDGLAGALSQAPWELPTVAIAVEISASPTQLQLARIAEDHGAGAVLIYSIRSRGRRAVVGLTLFSGGKSVEKLTEEIATASQHGLVYWNPTFIVTISVVGGLLLMWLVWATIRGTGTIRIELKTDPAGERPSFSVLISKRNKCPTVTDPKAHLASVSLAESVGRFKGDNVGAVSEFERVPPGSWFVHIYGAYEKAGELRCLPQSTAPAKVKRNRVTIVNVDLVPKESEFQIIIADDGGPAAGAEMWLSTQPGRRYVSDAGGKAVVFAPTGEHLLHATYRGQQIVKQLSAYGSRVQTVSINMVRERRLAAVAAGLEVGSPSQESVEIINSSGQSVAITPSMARAQLNEAVMSQADLGASATMMPPAGGEASPPDGALVGLRRYLAGSELGRGAMGVVYRAVDQVLDRTVALKVMAKEFREHPRAAQMFEQEAKALAALNHPNVVTVYDQGRDGDEIFLVMEFVEGQTLEAILETHGRLPLINAIGIGEQLGRGLSYAHSKRVIHRDIKPGNVFVSTDGTVKLGDFGLAKILNEVQIKKTEIKGTPLYMAPEQIRGSDIDFRADIYALGCTMYEVLCGRPPFIDGEILWHHVYTEPDPITNYVQVPGDVADLIMKCIVKDKAHRVSSADHISKVFGKIRRTL